MSLILTYVVSAFSPLFVVGRGLRKGLKLDWALLSACVVELPNLHQGRPFVWIRERAGDALWGCTCTHREICVHGHAYAYAG